MLSGKTGASFLLCGSKLDNSTNPSDMQDATKQGEGSRTPEKDHGIGQAPPASIILAIRREGQGENQGSHKIEKRTHRRGGAFYGHGYRWLSVSCFVLFLFDILVFAFVSYSYSVPPHGTSITALIHMAWFHQHHHWPSEGFKTIVQEARKMRKFP